MVIFRDSAELRKELNQLNEKQGYSEPMWKSKKGDRSKNVSFTSKLEAWNPSRNCC